MIILKSYQIKLSHNLNPKSEKVNIVSFTDTVLDNSSKGDDEDIANVTAFNGNRPKCEI